MSAVSIIANTAGSYVKVLVPRMFCGKHEDGCLLMASS